MRTYWTLGYRLPRCLSVPLYGDRRRFGRQVLADDEEWKEWIRSYLVHYDQITRTRLGHIVHDAGYRVMKQVDIAGKRVLEIGPGNLQHINYWNGTPELYVIADISETLLRRAALILSAKGVCYKVIKLDPSSNILPFEDNNFDLLIAFYILEHLYPLNCYLNEYLRVLRNSGRIAGAIPCEGGLFWGCGRYLTTTRWLRRATAINPEKIYSWEHPNFAETVLKDLDRMMLPICRNFWPTYLPVIDLNLVARFIYQKGPLR